MKALILAAGYGTRFARDLEARVDGAYQHLRGVPKPLLPVAGCPLISHWVSTLQSSPGISGIYVVVGSKHPPTMSMALHVVCCVVLILWREGVNSLA